jgi:mycothiol system anti-sigma-R factor
MDEQENRYRVEDLFGGNDCDEALHTLYHFLDGELTADRRAAIEHHLKECQPCLRAFDFEAELKAVIGRSCRDQVPDELRRRIADALAEASGDELGTV